MPTFRNARYVFGRDEYAHWVAHQETPSQAAVFADSIQPVVDAGRVDLVASDAQLSEEITLIPTPGHSPGHMSVLIFSGGATALLTGDAAHHPVQMAHLDWSSAVDFDPLQAAATRRALFARFADTATLVIGGHFGAGHIQREGDAFRFAALQH
jgi:glyoxylase-like metal-dependent hydrolase (beta-lactamase superfamily II)